MANMVRDMVDSFVKSLEQAMNAHGDIACSKMRELIEKKPQRTDEHGEPYYKRTGRLIESIKCNTVSDDEGVTTYIYADAKGPTGAQYAEFLEYGTGKYNKNGGRSEPWVYYDIHGKRHKTEGMEAYPFIEPSVEEAFSDMDSTFLEVFEDIKKYNGGGG